MIIVTAESLRQYLYCPRIIYFRYVLGAKPPETLKMQIGKEIHEKLKQIADKNTLVNVFLVSEELGLSGIADIIKINGNEATVLEAKLSKFGKKIDEHHKIQLAAYKLLVENVLKLKVKCTGVYYIDEDQVIWIRLDKRHEQKVLETIKHIREIIQHETIPNPTPNIAKCDDCEYYIYCQRI